MAEAKPPLPSNGGDQISIPTPWGGTLAARGSMVILVLLLFAGGYVTIWQNQERELEHEQIREELVFNRCLMKLDIWVHSIPEGQVLNFNRMPSDLWSCTPHFLTDSDEQHRKR